MSIFKGSVCDLTGNDGLASSITAAGVNLELSRNNSGFTGITAGVGTGFNIGYAIDGTVIFSQKHGLIRP